MALPLSNSSWPIQPFERAYKAMAGWDAWYTGDTDMLATFYGANTASRPSTFSKNGLVGTVKQFMWGRPQDGSTPQTRLHVPIAADIARTSADLLFAEPPTFLVGEGKSKTQDLLADMLGNEATKSTLIEGGEVQAALGGTYLRLIWDKEMFDYIQLQVVHADGAIPEWRYGQLHAVTFWEVLESPNKSVWRHLERHERGVIEHALYEGGKETIGIRKPLQENQATAYLAKLVNADGAIPTLIEGRTAAYVPNLRPNRIWRKLRDLSPLGRSDFDQIEPLLDAADETWSALMREMRLSKARAFVDTSMLDNNGPGQGGNFDTDREIFTAVQGTGSMKDGVGIDTFQPDIRHEAFRSIILDITNTALRSAGYSAASFSEDPMLSGGSKTATEVNSERELSHRTRDKKILHWQPALAMLGSSALELQKAVYGSPVDMDQVTVRFPTRTGVDPVSMANTLNLLNSAGAISLDQKVRRLNPNWDSDALNTEVGLIKAELGQQALSDPTKVGSDVNTPTPAEQAAAALAAKQAKQ